ncbi:MAG: response regulator [Pseudomonadota bacterium]
MGLGNGHGVSIFWRLLTAFALVNVATSSILIAAAYVFSKGSLEHRAKESISQQVAVIRAQFEKEFRTDLDRTLRWLTASSHIDDYLFASHTERLITTKKLEHLFRRAIKDSSSYVGVTFVDADGELAARAPHPRQDGIVNLKQHTARNAREAAQIGLYAQIETTPLLLSSGNMEWFMPPRQMWISDPIADERGVSAFAALAKLDLDTGTFGGVVFVSVSLNSFFDYLGRVKFFDANSIWVLGRGGEVLLAPRDRDATFDPRSSLGAEFAGQLQMVHTDEGIVAYQDFSVDPGQPFMRMAVSVPSSLLVKDLSSSMGFFSLVLLISFIVVLLVSLYISRYLSGPIVQLAAAASRMARGDLDAAVAIRTTGEVQTLVSSFNTMTQELRESISARDASVDTLTREVAERKRAERELKVYADELLQAREAAEAADRAKGEFLATMSHEIRTPINGVLGMTELLLHTDLDRNQQRLTRTARRSGQGLLNIVNDVLDFSKIEAGKLELECEPFDLRDLIQELLEMFAEATQSKGVELLFAAAADTPLNFCGDPGRLRQILTNLVGNAVKFTEHGEVVVAVTNVIPGTDTARVSIEVRDSGVGIPADMQARIFDAFSQADGSTTRRFGGTGLGLGICKKLVQLMDGQLTVASQPGEGSTFQFNVELGFNSADSPAQRPVSEALQAARILVVDDNATHGALLSAQLDAWSIENSSADNGVRALECLRAALDSRPFDIVLLDTQFPDGVGLDIANAIGADTALAQVSIVLMGSVMHDIRETVGGTCVNAFLAKPIRRDELRGCLERLCGESASTVRTGAYDELTCLHGIYEGRVLIADDNAVNCMMAEEMVQLLGPTAVVVADGQAAVAALAGGAFDLVLMDCQMPIMDGFEATAKIRSIDEARSPAERVPIVALTANAFEGTRRRCLDADMDDYLAKPFELDDLRELFERWLRRRPAEGSTGVARSRVRSAELAPSQGLDPKALANIRSLQRPGRASAIVRFSKIFRATGDALIARLRLVVDEADRDELRAVAHSFKSCGANVGATALTQRCAHLERVAADMTDAELVTEIADIESLYAHACAELDELCRHEEVA